MITSPTTSIKLKSFPFKFIGRRTPKEIKKIIIIIIIIKKCWYWLIECKVLLAKERRNIIIIKDLKAAVHIVVDEKVYLGSL